MSPDPNPPDIPFDPTNLKPGQMLGSRYRILELLGTGGMGVVYRAADLELNVDVALKLLRSDLLKDEKAVERMKTELILARQVSHRNVVRIHDLGSDEEGTGLRYISMAYIQGETLRRILERRGSFTANDAVPIMIALCNGLEAAHEVGVVHRDFKPENIIVDEKGHPYITDFGVARSVEHGGLTKTGNIVGTLQYMSPEQARGEKVDQRSDIYSFGLVGYEMLTGKLSHASETTPEFVSRILGHKPQDPREVSSDIPEYLSDIVLRCLEPEPAMRYPSAREVAQALESRRPGTAPLLSTIVSTIAPTVPLPKRARRRAYLALGSLAVIILMGGYVAYWFVSTASLNRGAGLGLQAPSPPIPIKGSVAVLPFLNSASDPQLDWLRTTLPEALIADLAVSKELRVPRGEEIFQLLRDLKFEEKGVQNEEALRLVARFLNCDLLATGSFALLGKDLVLDFKLFKSGAGGLVPLTPIKKTGPAEALLTLTRELAAEIRKSIDPSLAAPDTAAETLTHSPAALKNYSLGLAKLSAGDFSQSVQFFERATGEDPEFVMAYAKLSEAHDQSGDSSRAQQAYERALEAIRKSRRVQLLDTYQFRAQHALLQNNLDAAINEYRLALVQYPHSAEIYRALGAAFQRKGDIDQAIESYEKAAQFEPNNLGGCLALGRLYIQARKNEKAAEQLNRGLTLSATLNNDQGRADALNALGIVHQRMRQFEDAEKSYRDSSEIKRKIGDRRGIAVTLQNMANLYSLQGKYGDAEKQNREALAIFQELNNEPGVSNILFNLGHLYQDTGRFDQALEHFHRALTIATQLKNIAFLADIGERIGQIHYLRGQYADAVTYHKLALVERERINDEEGKLRSYQSIGDLDLEQGRFEEGLQRHRSALTLARKLRFSEAAAVSMSQMGWIYQLTGRYKAAFDSYREARNEFMEQKIAARLAELDKRLGALYLEMGNRSAAAENLQSALKSASEIDDPGLLGQIALLQGDSALSEGKTAAARDAYMRATASAQKSRSARDLLNAETQMARLESLHGDRRKGVKMLRTLLSRAEEIVQAEVIARCYVYLAAVDGEKIPAAQLSRWYERLREFGLKRYRVEFALLAAGREERAKRPKEVEAYRREAASILDELCQALDPPQQTALRQALRRFEVLGSKF